MVNGRRGRCLAEQREKRTVCQIFASCFVLTHVIDAAMGRVIIGKPIPAFKEVFAAPLVLETEGFCPGAQCEGKRKRGEERIANTHS